MQINKRAIACSAWRWMPGMKTTNGIRIIFIHADGSLFGWHERDSYLVQANSESLPDLEDAATRGFLLALVREAWGEPLMSAVGYIDHLGPRWRIDADLLGVGDMYDCSSEIEALVEALEAAGVRADNAEDGER